MESILNQTLLLRELLSKFVSILYLDDVELERMHDFIFSTKADTDIMPVEGVELYDTLDFLRDLAQDGNYTTVEQLLAYFEDQDTRLDTMIKSVVQVVYRERATSGDMSYTFCSYRPGMKMIGYPMAAPDKSHEDIVEDLFQCLSSNEEVQGLESHYTEIDKIKKKPSKNPLRSCSLHAHILPNTDYVHFDHYYRSFAPQKKGYLRFVSVIKRIKAWFSDLRWEKPLQIPSDIVRKHRERIKVKKLYENIYSNIRKENPIENDQVKLDLSMIMLIAKFNNPLFRSQQLTDSNEHEFDFKSRPKFYQLLSRKNWVVLKSPEGLSWNTTENPGFSIDMDDVISGSRTVSPDPYWTEMSENSLIYFPLSDQYCLRLAPDNFPTVMMQGSKIDFEQSSEQELEVVNKLLLVSKPDVLISPHHGIKKRTEGMVCEIG